MIKEKLAWLASEYEYTNGREGKIGTSRRCNHWQRQRREDRGMEGERDRKEESIRQRANKSFQGVKEATICAAFVRPCFD